MDENEIFEKERTTSASSAESDKKSIFAEVVFPVLKRGGKKVKAAFSVAKEGVGKISESFWELWEAESAKEGALRKNLIFFSLALLIFLASLVISLAAFPLGVYPAGLALISSVGGRRRGKKEFEKNSHLVSTGASLVVFGGALLSCAFLPKYGFYTLLIYMALFIFRAVITSGKLDEPELVRVTISAIGAVSSGLLFAALDGFLIERVFAGVSLTLLTVVFTYLLCGFYMGENAVVSGFGAITQRRIYPEATLGTLLFLFLVALRDVEILNFSLPFVLGTIATLAVSRSRGALYGAAVGVIGGMACGNTALIAPLALAGFFSGLFFDYSGLVAEMVAFITACGYSIYSGGFDEFGSITADFVCALVLFFPLMKTLPKEKEAAPPLPQTVLHKETIQRARKKLKNMSDAFSSLSEVFYTVSDTMKKPQITETTRLVSDSCSALCSGCKENSYCWGREFNATSEATALLAATLMEKGSIEAGDFAEPFASHCQRKGELTERINRRFSGINGSFYKNNKTRLLAGEYSSVSRLIKNTAGELDKELEYSPREEARVQRLLKSLEIPFRRVTVFGTREMKIDVYGISLPSVQSSTEEILKAFEKEFSFSFEDPSFLMFDGKAVMRLRRKRKITLECAKSGCTKKGEAVNGDSTGFFETDRDFFYTLICDGMGSGREAAFTSRLASIFIEKLMTCSSPKNVTLEMLNTFLMSKTDETFTTVDLFEVDLLSGEGNFIKAGAAPSFILRGDRIHRIESRTPPAGIIGNMCAEQTSLPLLDGDFIILVSDGAVPAGSDPGWLMKLLTTQKYESAAALCEALFSAAKEATRFQDDLSISVLRVVNAQ